jgi:flagellar hook-associated protein 2
MAVSSSSAPVAFSGIVSGLNTSSIITSLVNAAKASESQYTSQQSALSDQKTAVDAISASLSSLGTFAQNLELPSTLQLKTATTSDSHLSVAVSGNATATTHTMRVEQVATAQTVSSKTFTTDAPGMLGTGSVQISSGSASATINYDSTDTLESIAAKINSANAGASASVLYDGTSYRLMVASNATGTANKTAFVDSGDSLQLSDPTNIKVKAEDAIVDIDGVPVTRSSNVIDDALPGATITVNSAQAATDPDTSVTVANDTTGLTSLLKKFVSNYNSVAGALGVQMTYNASATTQAPLFGDSTLRQLQSSMSAIASQNFGGTNLTQLGITIDSDGNMSLDTDTLNATLQHSPNAISDMFVTNGLATAMFNMTSEYTDPVNGILTAKDKSITDQTSQLKDAINQIEANATAMQTRLQDEFNQLETTMSTLQSEGNYVSKMFATKSS